MGFDWAGYGAGPLGKKAVASDEWLVARKAGKDYRIATGIQKCAIFERAGGGFAECYSGMNAVRESFLTKESRKT